MPELVARPPDLWARLLGLFGLSFVARRQRIPDTLPRLRVPLRRSPLGCRLLGLLPSKPHASAKPKFHFASEPKDQAGVPLNLREKLERDHVPYCLATVVAVRGSASAKPGSKMLVSFDGKNLWGWVGGGCAESYTIAHCLEAIQERRPRTITADLDDEVFGLGMPCGGQMDIFLDPIHPPETLRFDCPRSAALATLTEHYGFSPRFLDGPESKIFLPPAECVRQLAAAIARSRELPGKALSNNAALDSGTPTELLILGHSRITEELAKLGALLGWSTRVYGLNLDTKNYPSSVLALEAQPEYAGLNLKPGSFVVVASHHKGDHHYLASALQANVAYVGLVASRKRTGLVFDFLRTQQFPEALLARVHAPAGLELHCRNPGEIALSIVAELLGP